MGSLVSDQKPNKRLGEHLGAISALSALKNVASSDAYFVSYTMAYAHAQLGDFQEATRYGTEASQWARTLDQQEQSKNLVNYIELGRRAAVRTAKASAN